MKKIMEKINLTFAFCFLLIVGVAISTALKITNIIDEAKEKESALKTELSTTLKQVKSDCKVISKEKQFDSNGLSTIIERYSCADGIDYSFFNVK